MKCIAIGFLLVGLSLLVESFNHPASRVLTKRPHSKLCLSDDDTTSPLSSLEREMEDLKAKFDWIEAMEERNKAQLDSFIDENDQLESMDPEERELLQLKDTIVERMDILSEELIQMWIGSKSMDG